MTIILLASLESGLEQLDNYRRQGIHTQVNKLKSHQYGCRTLLRVDARDRYCHNFVILPTFVAWLTIINEL